MNKSVLIVTPFFAPQSHAAVFRAYKLAKYLPRFGWKPYVLTTDTNYKFNEDLFYAVVYYKFNEDLRKERVCREAEDTAPSWWNVPLKCGSAALKFAINDLQVALAVAHKKTNDKT